MIIEVEPRENIAAGRFGWGLDPWAPPGSVRRVNVLGNGEVPEDAMAILAAAAGRSLVAVMRDAHRDPNTRSLVEALLAARPIWSWWRWACCSGVRPKAPPTWPPGASRASAKAAAKLLGRA